MRDLNLHVQYPPDISCPEQQVQGRVCELSPETTSGVSVLLCRVCELNPETTSGVSVLLMGGVHRGLSSPPRLNSLPAWHSHASLSKLVTPTGRSVALFVCVSRLSNRLLYLL
jgi:hypothetical protein